MAACGSTGASGSTRPCVGAAKGLPRCCPHHTARGQLPWGTGSGSAIAGRTAGCHPALSLLILVGAALELLQKWDVGLDLITFTYILWNFAVGGWGRWPGRWPGRSRAARAAQACSGPLRWGD